MKIDHIHSFFGVDSVSFPRYSRVNYRVSFFLSKHRDKQIFSLSIRSYLA